MIGTFYGKEFLWSKLQMSHYPELDNHVRDKVKVVLDLLSHSTKKKKKNMAQALIYLI